MQTKLSSQQSSSLSLSLKLANKSSKSCKNYCIEKAQPHIKGQGSCGFYISTHSNHSEDPTDYTLLSVYSLVTK